VIKERRNLHPEARQAAHAQAIKEGKEKKAAAESKKKADKAKSAAGAARGQGQKVSKQSANGAPNKGTQGKEQIIHRPEGLSFPSHPTLPTRPS
jgi:hypothetical protein